MVVGLTRGGRLDSWWWSSLSAAAVGGVFRLSWNRGLKQLRAGVAGPVEWDRSQWVKYNRLGRRFERV